MKSSSDLNSPAKRSLKPEEFLQVYHDLHKRFGDQHWWPGETPFEIIVGAILTQNAAWINVEKAIRNLKQAGKLNPKALYKMPQKKLAVLIRPAGFFNLKAERLKHFLHFLFRNYQGSLKRMFWEDGLELRQKLLAVKGIGPETADSILLYAGQKPFFVIDAYTRRIFSRHKVPLRHDADYHDWQKVFMNHLPADTPLYNDFHAQIVRLAKDFCRSKKLLCETCPLHKYL